MALSQSVRWTAEGAAASLSDGDYVIGIRPHHVTPAPTHDGAVKVEGRVLVTELSGSESVIHFDLDGHVWVSQSHGVHAMNVGDHAAFYVDVRQCLVFDQDEKRAA